MASFLTKEIPHQKTSIKHSSFLLLPALAKVSWQRFRVGLPLLSVIWLAMVVMVTLVCVEPLFGRMTTSAQLQDVARAAGGGASFTIEGTSVHPTMAQIEQAQKQLNQTVHAQLGNQAGDASLLDVQTPYLQILPSQASPAQTTAYAPTALHGVASGGPPLPPGNALAISAYNPTEAAGQLTVLAGRLPSTTGNQLEIAVPEQMAHDLGLQVGMQITVRYPVEMGSTSWQLTVVGIIRRKASAGDFWHDNLGNSDVNPIPVDNTTVYHALAAQQVLVPALSTVSTSSVSSFSFALTWRCPLYVDNLDANALGTFLAHYQTFENQLGSAGTLPGAGGLTDAFVESPDFVSTLQSLQSSLAGKEVIALFLLCLSIVLALLMVGTMSYVLVESQMATIATMRSRGASRSHIFWVFAIQGGALVLLAACAGIALALLLARVLAAHLLSQADQSVATLFDGNFSQVILEVRWFVFLVVVLALLTMLIAVHRAMKFNIVSLRRETARATHQPFWRRFYLDIILAVLICVGYGLYIYTFLSPLATSQSVQQLQTVFSLVMVPLIVLTILLLFLRVLPLLSRVVTRIIARRGSTAALLAFAQIERAPQAASRLLLLLVLALSSSFYMLGLVATQQQWYPDEASLQVGADFSGALRATDENKSFAQLMSSYGAIHGVDSVTLGYGEKDINYTPVGTGQYQLSFNAVDADTYASTARWPSGYSQQSLSDLMQQLKMHRADASSRDVVYAIVDSAMWKAFGLFPGASFSLVMPGYGTNQSMHFVALAKVDALPGVHTTAPFYNGIGLLADYQSYTTVYAKDNKGQRLSPNTVWLRTADDAASLASVRQAVPSLMDRRALLGAAQSNPDNVDMLSIFVLGTIAALGLALLGTLIVSWVSITGRRTQFAALHALGMPSRQINAILIWEHGIVYALALALGIGLGWLVSFSVRPGFSLIRSVIYDPASTATNVLVHTSFPLALAALLVSALFIVNGVVLGVGKSISRPDLQQTLRLNED